MCGRMHVRVHVRLLFIFALFSATSGAVAVLGEGEDPSVIAAVGEAGADEREG